nr:CDP-alcohol phosphatidyltransferase family protein [uncultured Friedmanniella sp.]
MSRVGWLAGLACGLVATVALSLGMNRVGTSRLGPADRVTLTRTVLIGGVAALVADALVRPPALAILVPLATVALVLDGVDGFVARRTGTASVLGARFDMEADAVLILILSLHVARNTGAWVLLLGAARYLFVAAGWLLPWMRARLPFRYWRKVVAATTATALIVAMAGVLPPAAAQAGLLLAVVLLAESFGRDVWWLYRRRRRLGSAAG